MAQALWKEDYLLSKDLFLAIMPIASAITSYWFASRDKGKIADGWAVNEGKEQRTGHEDG